MKNNQLNYDNQLWNKMRGLLYDINLVEPTKNLVSHAHTVPVNSLQIFENTLYDNSVFRKVANVIKGTNGDLTIHTYEHDAIALWGKNNLLELYDEIDSPIKKPIDAHKLSYMTHLPEENIIDSTFNLETVIMQLFGKGFANAEDKAFINGSGIDEPTGILHKTNGAQIGLTASSITYENVIKLFFSLDQKYRTNAKWMMNDETAMLLRELKSSTGLPLWNHNSDTIFSKEVLITNEMPTNTTPIAFGDFSHYAIVTRIPLTMNVLRETFAMQGHIGYVGYEYLDAKLMRQDSIQLLELES